jgi:hypothetical protein
VYIIRLREETGKGKVRGRRKRLERETQQEREEGGGGGTVQETGRSGRSIIFLHSHVTFISSFVYWFSCTFAQETRKRSMQSQRGLVYIFHKVRSMKYSRISSPEHVPPTVDRLVCIAHVFHRLRDKGKSKNRNTSHQSTVLIYVCIYMYIYIYIYIYIHIYI